METNDTLFLVGSHPLEQTSGEAFQIRTETVERMSFILNAFISVCSHKLDEKYRSERIQGPLYMIGYA